MSVQSKTKARGYKLCFINDCSCLTENKSIFQHIALLDEAVQ